MIIRLVARLRRGAHIRAPGRSTQSRLFTIAAVATVLSIELEQRQRCRAQLTLIILSGIGPTAGLHIWIVQINRTTSIPVPWCCTRTRPPPPRLGQLALMGGLMCPPLFSPNAGSSSRRYVHTCVRARKLRLSLLQYIGSCEHMCARVCVCMHGCELRYRPHTVLAYFYTLHYFRR